MKVSIQIIQFVNYFRDDKSEECIKIKVIIHARDDPMKFFRLNKKSHEKMH